MRKGKLAAQAAHASLKVFLDRKTAESGGILTVPITEEMSAWINGTFTKIVLGVESEADLLRAHEAAVQAGIPSALIQDQGYTEFHGVPTYTTCAIGPDLSERIDSITGKGGVIPTKLL